LASVFRQGNLFNDIRINQLLKMLPDRRLTLAWIDVIEFFQRRQFRGMSKNILEKRESCLLGNDIKPIPDGFDLMCRVIGHTRYFII
jgi:hypothetical protein